jgi:capsular exopolysaccharide synthesis family protein
MTTLPTPSRPATRYPRSRALAPTNGNGRALATGGPGGPGGPNQAPSGLTGADIYRVLRQNMWLILGAVILSLIGGVASFLYLNANHQRTEAEGFIAIDVEPVIDPVTGVAVAGTQDQELEIEQQSQVAAMQRPGLLDEVLSDRNGETRRTDWFQSFVTPEGTPDIDAARRDLADNLSVGSLRGTRFLRVAVALPEAEDAVVVVRDLIAKHVDSQMSAERSDLRDRENSLQSRILTLEQTRREAERDRDARTANIGGNTERNNRGGVIDMELQSLTRQIAEAEARLQQAQSSFESFNAAIARGENPPMVKAMVEADPQVQQYQSMVNEIETSLTTTRDRLGANHNTTKALALERDKRVNLLENRRAEVESQQRTIQESTLNSELSAAEVQLGALAEEKERVAARKAEIVAETQAILARDREIERSSESIARLQNTLAALTQQRQSSRSSTIRAEGIPRAEDGPSFPKLPVVMAAALLIGLALSLGIAFLREFMDTSVRSPRDISRVGQMTLLGMIPHQSEDRQAGKVVPAKVVGEAPMSVTAEQYRQVRNRLTHAAPPETTKTLLVTSPSPDDGKTTVAINLAAAMALNNRRVLLVDANFRKPGVHNVFNLDNAAGFADVLRDTARFDELVSEADVPNLSVMPAGRAGTAAAELIEGHGFGEFVDRALEEFDVVMFDGGPVLHVSEAAALAPKVDGVISVARASTNSRGLLQRLRDTLRQLKAEHVGVVLNGVRHHAGGYFTQNIRTYYDYTDVPATK